MTRETTYTLFVNLSASQVRKRLKGHGWGVRRVEATDRNQAAITHTATGGHLRQLQALFADVLSSPHQQAVGTPVENLKNLGATSARWLREIGVHSRSDLETVGAAQAYRLAKEKFPTIGPEFLCALAAALSDRHVSELSAEEKARLHAQATGDAST
jgi:DNA transformation protein